MRSRLRVENLPTSVTESELTECLSGFGRIVNIKLVREPERQPAGVTGEVELENESGAKAALDFLNQGGLLAIPIS